MVMNKATILFLEVHRNKTKAILRVVELTKQLEPVVKTTAEDEEPIIVQSNHLMRFQAVRIGHVIEGNLCTISTAKNIPLFISCREKRMGAEVILHRSIPGTVFLRPGP